MPQMTREEFAFTVKQKYPEYRDIDNDELVKRVVTKYPEYRQSVIDLEPERPEVQFTETEETPGLLERPQDMLHGALAGVGKTVTGLGELGTRLGNALRAALAGNSPMGAFTQDDASTQPFAATRADIDEATPDTPGARVGETAEQMAEFFIPGAAGLRASKGAGLLARMGVEAAGAGAVGSAQQGNLDPASAVGGAGGAAFGAGMGAATRRLGTRAAETFSRIVRPRGEHAQSQVTAAIEALARGEGGNLPVGGIQSLADKLAAQADTLAERVQQFRAGAAKAVPTDDVVRELQAVRQSLHGAESGQVLDPTMLAQVDEMLGQVERLTATGAGRPLPGIQGPNTGVNPEALEELLRTASDRIYAMSSDPAAGTVRAGLERGADAMRRGLNQTQPGRADVTVPFSNQRALADSVEAQASGARYKEPPQAGQILALSALGAAGGGAITGDGGGAASGALIAGSIPLLGSRLLKSPLWRSLSARAQAELAQLLSQMPQDEAGRLINSLLQVEVGEQDAAQP